MIVHTATNKGPEYPVRAGDVPLQSHAHLQLWREPSGARMGGLYRASAVLDAIEPDLKTEPGVDEKKKVEPHGEVRGALLSAKVFCCPFS